MNGSRLALFLTMALSIWGVLHLYVFWRLSSVPWIEGRCSGRMLVITGVSLWLSYVVARVLSSWHLDALANPLEFVASTWMGILFLLFAAFLVLDIVTLGGALLTQWMPSVRGWVALAVLVLAFVAQVQGLRPPVVTRHEVAMPGLPAERDGTTLVAITDLHLGRLLDAPWFSKRVKQINELRPDCIVAVGDVVDGNARELKPLVSALQELKAPMGVWAVSGNHEFYEGLEHSLAILGSAGWHVLRDEAVEIVPGLVLAGVDDLTARPQWSESEDPLKQALIDRPAGATILLSHSPMHADQAAAQGARLMLSGHTHAGQLWPFNYLVALRYPLLSGRYDVDGMTVIVCRGTGTWGPRMRLWKRSEILHMTLRSAE